jgi:hypothetical protein
MSDVLTYYYTLNGPGFIDKEEFFADKVENHLAMIKDFLTYIYETVFISGYSEPIYQIVSRIRGKVLNEKKLTLVLRESPDQQIRIDTYAHLIVNMGGKYVGDQNEADIIVKDDDIEVNVFGTEVNSVQWLVKAWFFLSAKKAAI